MLVPLKNTSDDMASRNNKTISLFVKSIDINEQLSSQQFQMGIYKNKLVISNAELGCNLPYLLNFESLPGLLVLTGDLI